MSHVTSEPAHGRIRRAAFAGRPYLPTILATAWLVAACLGAMAPTLLHGTKLGSYDLLSVFGLGVVRGTPVHNVVSSDQIQQFLPWTNIAWKSVHHGNLPLWNPYSAMGTPLAFDMQSATFSLPMLVAYLAPLRFAYTTFVLVKIILAGTGMLFFSRVMGLGCLAGAFAGTVFELSGAFGGWAGWPMATVLCMLGWVLGSALLVLREKGGWRYLPLLAVTVAFAAYGGHPESFAMLLVVLTIMVVVVVASKARGEGTAVLWSAGRAAAGVCAGLALAAPLLLPGLQAIEQSAASTRAGYTSVPVRNVVNLVVAGYDGFPTLHSMYFGVDNYYESAAFVGITVLVLVAVALTSRWRHPAVGGLVIAALFLSAAVWWSPMARLLDHIPGAKMIVWRRGVIVLDGILAVLGAFGLQLVREAGATKSVARRLVVAAAAGCLVLLLLVVRQLHGSGAAHAIRDHSLVWPCIAGVVTLAVALGLMWRSRAGARRGAHGVRTANKAALAGALILFAAESAFLLTAVPHLWSSSTQSFAATPAERQLQAIAGDQRVGFGQCPKPVQLARLGILPEANAAYGVIELGMYDAVLPKSYLPTYAKLSHTPVAKPVLGNFCPSMTTASLARDYGVSIVLEPPHSVGPAGTVSDGTVGNEGLFRVPGGSIVTLQPQDSPADDPLAQPVAVSDADPEHLNLVVHAKTTSRLDIHIGNFPGWTATLDGRPLALHSFLTDEMQATVPSGHHTIVLQYRPRAFELGVVLAAAALVALLAGWLLGFRKRTW